MSISVDVLPVWYLSFLSKWIVWKADLTQWKVHFTLPVKGAAK